MTGRVTGPPATLAPMPTPDIAPAAPDPYRYELHLDSLDLGIARFVYLDAPAPAGDDTALLLNRESWDALGRPGHVTVTIEARQ